MQRQCQDCDADISHRNKAAFLCEACYKDRNCKRVTKYRRRLKQRAIEYLGGKCQQCGYAKCPLAFDFHHKDPSEKDFTISNYSNLCWAKIEAEIKKCILLCANCHRELHWQEINAGVCREAEDT